MAKNVKRYSQGGSFKNINIGGASALQQQRAHSQTVIQGLERQKNAIYKRDKDSIQSAIDAERAEKTQRRENFGLTEAEYSTREKAINRNRNRDAENNRIQQDNLKRQANEIEQFSKVASEGLMFGVKKLSEAQAAKDFQAGLDYENNIQDDVIAKRVFLSIDDAKSNEAINLLSTDPNQSAAVLEPHPKRRSIAFQRGLAQGLIQNNTFSEIFDEAIQSKLDITDPDSFKNIGNQVIHAFYKAYGLDPYVHASHLTGLKEHTKGVVSKHVGKLELNQRVLKTTKFYDDSKIRLREDGILPTGSLDQQALGVYLKAGYLKVDKDGNYGGNRGMKDAAIDLLSDPKTSPELIRLLEEEGITPDLKDPSKPGTFLYNYLTIDDITEAAATRLDEAEKISKSVEKKKKAFENTAIGRIQTYMRSPDYPGTIESNDEIIEEAVKMGISPEGISKIRLEQNTTTAQRELITLEYDAKRLIKSGQFTEEFYYSLPPTLRGLPEFKSALSTAVEFNRVVDSENINITTLSVGRIKQLLKDKSVYGNDTPSVTLGAGLYEKTLRQNFNNRWRAESKKDGLEPRKSAEEIWQEVRKELDDRITQVNSDTNPDTTSPWYARRDPGEESATLPNILSRSSDTDNIRTAQQRGWVMESAARIPGRALGMPWADARQVKEWITDLSYGLPVDVPKDVQTLSELSGWPVHKLMNSWKKLYEDSGAIQKGFEDFPETFQYKIQQQPDVQKSSAALKHMIAELKSIEQAFSVYAARALEGAEPGLEQNAILQALDPALEMIP